MEMNATEILYQKMLAYGDRHMAYGPAAPSGERFGMRAEFVGYDQRHGVSFEQGGPTRHGTRYSGVASPLASNIAQRSPPGDLVHRVHYGHEADLPLNNMDRGTFGSDDLSQAHSDDRAKAQMGLGVVVKSETKDGGDLSNQKRGEESVSEYKPQNISRGGVSEYKPVREFKPMGTEHKQPVRKAKEKPLCSICGQVKQ